MRTLILILASILPQPDIDIVQAYDLAEVNHLYNEKGLYLYTQVIWWNWIGDDFYVEDWRLVRCEEKTIASAKEQAIIPRKERCGYVSRWDDKGYPRRVYASFIRETWTLSADDPEKINQEKRPKEERKNKLKEPYEIKPFVLEWRDENGCPVTVKEGC